MEPRVSVVMSVRNEQRFVAQAINSILCQDLRELEFIIVNDGSTDDTPRILAESAACDARVRIVPGLGQGLTRALNVGWRHARGRYVARMDGDDVALSDRLMRQATFLDKHSQVVAVGAWVQLIDEDGDPIAIEHWETDPAKVVENLLHGGAGLPHPAAMIRRAALEAVQGYREEFTTAQDVDLWLRLSEIGKICNLPEVLLRYRLHGRSVSSNLYQDQRSAVRRAVHDAWIRRGMPVDCRELKRIEGVAPRGNLLWYWGLTAVEAGHTATALKFSRRLRADASTARLGFALAVVAGVARCCGPLLPVLKPPVRAVVRTWRRLLRAQGPADLHVDQ